MSGFMTKIRIFSYKVENNTNLDIQGDNFFFRLSPPCIILRALPLKFLLSFLYKPLDLLHGLFGRLNKGVKA